jgi:hypothetical protein
VGPFDFLPAVEVTEIMSGANIPIDRKRMADGTVKPASTLHVATKVAADPSPPPPSDPSAPASASASASVSAAMKPKLKPAFRPAKDDTKPTLRDPVRRDINLYRFISRFFFNL